MPYKQKVISSEDKLLTLTLVSYAMVHLRMSCMQSGAAKNWRLYGI